MSGDLLVQLAVGAAVIGGVVLLVRGALDRMPSLPSVPSFDGVTEAAERAVDSVTTAASEAIDTAAETVQESPSTAFYVFPPLGAGVWIGRTVREWIAANTSEWDGFGTHGDPTPDFRTYQGAGASGAW